MKFVSRLFFALTLLGCAALAGCRSTDAGSARSIPAEQWSIAVRCGEGKTTDYCVSELQELLAYRIGKKLPVIKDPEAAGGRASILKAPENADEEKKKAFHEKDFQGGVYSPPLKLQYSQYSQYSQTDKKLKT